jgi:hypothetical protein
VIVIVENGNVPLAEIAVRPHFRVARIEARGIVFWLAQTLGDIVQREKPWDPAS